MLKKTVYIALFVVLGFGLVIVAEIVLALRREYLPTEPRLTIEGSFGTSGQPLRFIVLGDSTAAGVGVDDPGDAYPTVLAKRLADDGYQVEMTSLGISGATIATLIDEQLSDVAALKPDLVFVAIGANDVTHLTSLSSVREGMETIVEELLATGATVVVSGVPDMRAAAFYEPLRSLAGWRGREVTGEIARVARDRGVEMVPLADLTFRYFADDVQGSHSADLFHPSAIGYGHWADAIYPYLKRALSVG